METVKKVKFPIASILFLYSGLSWGIGAIISFIPFILVIANDPTLLETIFIYKILPCIFIIVEGLIYLYTAIILFAKKRNGLLKGGISALLVLKLLDIIAVPAIKLLHVAEYDISGLSFENFMGFYVKTWLSDIFSVIHLFFLIILLVTVICLTKENSKSHNFFSKIWFVPAIIYFLYQLVSTVMTVIDYAVNFFKTESYVGDLTALIITIFTFILFTIPLAVAFLLLTKWLKSPYKFIKPKEIKETPAPTQNVPVYENTYDNGIIIEETEVVEEKTEEVIEQFETPAPITEPEPIVIPEPVSEPEPIVIPEPISEPEPIVIPEPISEPEPIVIPEPISMPEPIVIPEPISEPQQTQEVKKNENTSSIVQATDDFYALKKLYDDGVITEEEFSQKKKQLLNL